MAGMSLRLVGGQTHIGGWRGEDLTVRATSRSALEKAAAEILILSLLLFLSANVISVSSEHVQKRAFIRAS